MMKAPPWDLSSPQFSQQEKSMILYRRWVVSPNTQARGQLLSTLTKSAYDDAAVMDDGNYVMVLEVLSVPCLCE